MMGLGEQNNLIKEQLLKVEHKFRQESDKCQELIKQISSLEIQLKTYQLEQQSQINRHKEDYELQLSQSGKNFSE